MKTLLDRRFWIGFLTGVVLCGSVILGIGFAVMNLTNEVQNQVNSETPISSEPIPLDWKLSRTNGETFEMSEIAGKYFFANIWTTWCAPCIKEMPSILALRDSLGSESNTAFLCLSEESESVLSKAAETLPQVPIFRFKNGIPRSLNVKAYPTTYILNPQGKILFRQVGAMDWSSDMAVTYVRVLLERDEKARQAE